MGELLHARRIYVDAQDGHERVVHVSLLFEDILDIRGSKGVGLKFKNRDPKTYVTLSGDRGMWLLIPLSRFRRMWHCYKQGDFAWDFEFTNN